MKIAVATIWQDEEDYINCNRQNKRILSTNNLTFEFLIESFACAKLSGTKLVVAGSVTMKN